MYAHGQSASGVLTHQDVALPVVLSAMCFYLPLLHVQLQEL